MSNIFERERIKRSKQRNDDDGDGPYDYVAILHFKADNAPHAQMILRDVVIDAPTTEMAAELLVSVGD